jgi:hypothetical protein
MESLWIAGKMMDSWNSAGSPDYYGDYYGKQVEENNHTRLMGRRAQNIGVKPRHQHNGGEDEGKDQVHKWHGVGIASWLVLCQ